LCYRFWYNKKNIKNLKDADGLVVGSAICKEITNSLKKRQNPVTKVSNMVKNLKDKIL
tara:strand:+ start:18 stop:191 length:174 start_codon:yes stop_codon:yes gene_type:complete